MMKKIRMGFLLVFISMLYHNPCQENCLAQHDSQSLPNKIDNLVNDYAANYGFMGSVLVANKGKIVFSKGYGLANVEKNLPNTPQTRFPIGSISKQFTAMLITQLAEKGKLRLDNTIADFIPGFPEDPAKKITVEMLLCHTSGLPLPEGIERYYYASTKEEFLGEFLKQLAEEGMRFEPGKGYGYSNAGYFILGLIIEKVTGKSYQEVLQKQILDPLNMSDTFCEYKGMEIENMAVSYQKLPDRYITWNEEFYAYDPAVVNFGAGQLISTVRDLFKFSRSFSSDKLLSRAYMDIFLKMRNIKSRPPVSNISQELASDFFGTCGNGFVGEISILEDPDTHKKEMLYWHDGTLKLFKSNHFHYSRKEQIIIICSNRSFLGEGNEIVLKIRQILNNKRHEQIRIKHRLSQYISEDIAMHAGIPAAIDEYFRFKDDTARFVVPGVDYLIYHGRNMVEQGDLENAILILQAALSAFPESWQAYDALGDVYVIKGNTEQAVQCFKKSLKLNPGNSDAEKKLNKLTRE